MQGRENASDFLYHPHCFELLHFADLNAGRQISMGPGSGAGDHCASWGCQSLDLNHSYNEICTLAKIGKVWPVDQFLFSVISKVVKIPSKPFA